MDGYSGQFGVVHPYVLTGKNEGHVGGVQGAVLYGMYAIMTCELLLDGVLFSPL